MPTTLLPVKSGRFCGKRSQQSQAQAVAALRPGFVRLPMVLT
ncbi:hypothetical protein [Nodosilinea sp. LEGE 07298]|nr:hypothetical protein [Nodosilinea sp. LEGE 07298]